MEERRSSPRKRILKSGKIFLGKHVVPCAVRNLSATGACLQVQTTEGLPSEFNVSLADQAARPCKVVWRDETRIGIAFK